MKKLTLLALSLAIISLTGCSFETMGSMAAEASPFGKPVEKNKELKSKTTKPDESVRLQGLQ